MAHVMNKAAHIAAKLNALEDFDCVQIVHD